MDKENPNKTFKNSNNSNSFNNENHSIEYDHNPPKIPQEDIDKVVKAIMDARARRKQYSGCTEESLVSYNEDEFDR